MLAAIFLFVSMFANAQATWDLVKDVQQTSNQISFQQGTNGVWYFMESAIRVHDPQVYRFLPQYVTPCPAQDIPFIVGLACWQGPEQVGPPTEVAANMTDQAVGNFMLYYPPHSVLISPTSDRYVIVAWRSPINGDVRVKGEFVYPNTNFANQLMWSVDKGKQTLRSGWVQGGGFNGIFNLTLAVSKGEVLYFIVDDPDGYCCLGITHINLHVTITQTP
jgi:hypothetical protein